MVTWAAKWPPGPLSGHLLGQLSGRPSRRMATCAAKWPRGPLSGHLLGQLGGQPSRRMASLRRHLGGQCMHFCMLWLLVLPAPWGGATYTFLRALLRGLQSHWRLLRAQCWRCFGASNRFKWRCFITLTLMFCCPSHMTCVLTWSPRAGDLLTR